MKPKSSLNFTENFIIVRRIRDDSEAREERRDWITNYLDAFLYLELGWYFNCIKVLMEKVIFNEGRLPNSLAGYTTYMALISLLNSFVWTVYTVRDFKIRNL